MGRKNPQALEEEAPGADSLCPLYIWLSRWKSLDKHGGSGSQGRKEMAHTRGKTRELLGEGRVDEVWAGEATTRKGECQES